MSHTTHTPQIHRRERTDRRQGTGFTRFVKRYLSYRNPTRPTLPTYTSQVRFTASLTVPTRSGQAMWIQSDNEFVGKLCCDNSRTLRGMLEAFNYDIISECNGVVTFEVTE